MIAHIKGTVAEKFNNSIIMDVSGVGYEVTVPVPDFEAVNLGEDHKFFTYHAVRENSEELYGFLTLAAKNFRTFDLRTGNWPKAAIAILSLAEAEEVRNAIANADSAFISKASGVGKKSAERVIVDLRDKVGIPSRYGAKCCKNTTPNQPDEALDALIALGFPLKEATAALEKVDPGLSVEERVKLALKN